MPEGWRVSTIRAAVLVVAALLLACQLHAKPRIAVEEGSGSFLMEGGTGHEGQTIAVHYHKPRIFNRGSPILIVLPGAGRNGDDYRDAWVQVSEAHGVLVLSPSYSKQQYA
jgi:poly(3-hydroxybutyrate) depolymerase